MFYLSSAFHSSSASLLLIGAEASFFYFLIVESPNCRIAELPNFNFLILLSPLSPYRSVVQSFHRVVVQFTVHFSLFTFHFSLFTVHFSLFTVHFSLFTVHSSLFTLSKLYRYQCIHQGGENYTKLHGYSKKVVWGK